MPTSTVATLLANAKVFSAASNIQLKAIQAALLNDIVTAMGSEVVELFGDDGYDPVLGAPYPPVNYSAYRHDTQPRITWTMPDLFVAISFETEPTVDGYYEYGRITISNYADPLPVGTVLSLYAFYPAPNVPPNTWHKVADSDGTPTGFLSEYEAVAGEPTFKCLVPFDGNYKFYVTAEAGGVTLSSNLVSGNILGSGGP